jgi:hypothetical protein
MIREHVPQAGGGAPGVVYGIDFPGYSGLLGQLAPYAFDERLVPPIADRLQYLRLGLFVVGELIAGALGEVVGFPSELARDPIGRVLGEHRCGPDGTGLIADDELPVTYKDGHTVENFIQRLGTPLDNGLSLALFHRIREDYGTLRTDGGYMLEKPVPEILNPVRHFLPPVLKTITSQS